MKHYKRFTKEEDELLKNIISQSKTIVEGFREAAKTLNRSESSISTHYYYSKELATLRVSKTKQIREKKQNYNVYYNNNKNEVKKKFKDTNGIFDKIRDFFKQLFH